MNKKLRVLVIGCGYFGQKRIQACLRLNTRMTIVGVVDINASLAKKTGEQLHVPYSTSIYKVLQKITAEAAIIAIPNKYHVIAVCEAIKNGLHVLCEKPLATSVTDAKKIISCSKKYKKFVKIGSNHRYFPTIQKAAKLISQGQIGKVLYLKGDIGTNGSHTKQSWFWDKKISGGGTFIDNASHMLDIARWFMGDFTTCIGETANVFWKQAKVEDVAGGMYKTKDGRIAIITSSWTKWSGYISLEIWGDKGYILINENNKSTVTFGENNSPKQKIYDFSNVPLCSYDDELTQFILCIQKNISPLPNAADGTRVIQMIEGVYASCRLKKQISLAKTV